LKCWNEFAQPGARAIRFEFTVCDDAAAAPIASAHPDGTVHDEGLAATKRELRRRGPVAGDRPLAAPSQIPFSAGAGLV